MPSSQVKFDYVYTPSGTDEFRSIHLELKIYTDHAELLLNSAYIISKEDLNKLLPSIQKEHFSKIKLNIAEDCEIILGLPEKSYKIILDKHTHEVVDYILL